MHRHLTRIWRYVLNTDQESQPKNIDNQDMEVSSEASSASSSFYMVSRGKTKNSSMSRRNESASESEMSSLMRQLGKVHLDDLQGSRATYPDNYKKNLEKELEKLQRRHAKMVRRIKGRMQELETLKRQDEEEKWEDDLLETRKRELAAANAIIDTRSSVSIEEILNWVKQINEQITHISSVSVVAGPERQHRSHLYDAIANALGHRFLPFFQKCGYSFEEQTIKTILQIYLACLCAAIIGFWNHEDHFNNRLDQFCNIIAVNESQHIAGKWRQMTFKQIPHGPEQEALQEGTVTMVQRILAVTSCAGWGGGNLSEIQALVEDLVMKARNVRDYAKVGLISADIQAWVVEAGDMYDPATMEATNSGSLMVLGSTGIGLNVRCALKDDGATLQPLLLSKVFCIRS